MQNEPNWDSIEVKSEDIIGLTFERIEGGKGSEQIRFYTKECEYVMYHSQDCCEFVIIEDICGDLNDLLGSPILSYEEVSSNELQPWQVEERTADSPYSTQSRREKNKDNPNYYEYDDVSFKWTFYKFSTIKGSVTIRWYGSSNGYYSVSVSFVRL